MKPTNIKNKQLAKKKAKKKKEKIKLDKDDIFVLSKINLNTREIFTLKIQYKQRMMELSWRQERIKNGLSWKCGFDKKGNIYPVRGRAR